MTTIRTRISGDYIKASCNTFNSCTTSCRTVNSQNCYRGRPHVFNLFTNYASPYNSTWSSSRPRAIPSYAPGIETSDGSLKDLAGGIIAVGAITVIAIAILATSSVCHTEEVCQGIGFGFQQCHLERVCSSLF
jgi:hypothetical protein